MGLTGPTFRVVSWANIGFVVVLGMLLVAWVACEPERRRAWARRWRAKQAIRRAVRVVRDEERAAEQVEQADLAAIHRTYRTSVRYYQAGHDPGELAPVWLPSKGPHPGTGRRSPESSSR